MQLLTTRKLSLSGASVSEALEPNVGVVVSKLKDDRSSVAVYM